MFMFDDVELFVTLLYTVSLRAEGTESQIHSLAFFVTDPVGFYPDPEKKKPDPDKAC